MATRTLNQNNFYFAFITDIHKQALAEHITVENMDYLRKGLKDIDENYPKVDDVSISSAKLSTVQMRDHIEFVIEFVGRFGITPKFVVDDFERAMQTAHNLGYK